MRNKAWTLFALLVGCTTRNLDVPSSTSSDAGTSPDSAGGTSTFALGSYGTCVEGRWTSSPGNIVENTDEFPGGAQTFTLTNDHGNVLVSFADYIGQQYSFTFSGSSPALLLSADSVVPYGFLCSPGPGHFNSSGLSMIPTSGTLTQNAGVLFLDVQGQVTGNAGPCGQLDQPSTFFVTCETPPSGTSTSTTVPHPSGLSSDALGPWSCDSLFAVGVDNGGTLTLAQGNGDEIIATYEGDSYVAGTLHLTSDSGSTAEGNGNDQLVGQCSTLPIAASSLTIGMDFTVLTFTGTTTTTPTCKGTQIVGTLVCTR